MSLTASAWPGAMSCVGPVSATTLRQKFINGCHKGHACPRTLHCAITKREPKEIPDHDLYVAGFPCQPFSNMGLREGMADSQGRGTIIEHVIDALKVKKPPAFILENVRGLVTQHRKDFGRIILKLRALNAKSCHVNCGASLSSFCLRLCGGL